jgi:hypothetical protein
MDLQGLVPPLPFPHTLRWATNTTRRGGFCSQPRETSLRQCQYECHSSHFILSGARFEELLLAKRAISSLNFPANEKII